MKSQRHHFVFPALMKEKGSRAPMVCEARSVKSTALVSDSLGAGASVMVFGPAPATLSATRRVDAPPTVGSAAVPSTGRIVTCVPHGKGLAGRDLLQFGYCVFGLESFGTGAGGLVRHQAREYAAHGGQRGRAVGPAGILVCASHGQTDADRAVMAAYRMRKTDAGMLVVLPPWRTASPDDKAAARQGFDLSAPRQGLARCW